MTIIMTMTMIMIMTMSMILSSVDVEVIGTVFIFYLFNEKILKHLKHKQKNLSNFHQNNKPKKHK